MAQVKHYAVCNQETNRNTASDNAVVSTRAEAGAISGTPAAAGTKTVTVTAQDGAGALATTTFTWTVAPSGAGIATTPLVGYKGMCLDVTGDNNTNGTPVEIYTCNGTGAQV